MKDSINGGQQGVRVDLNNSGQIAGLLQAKQQEMNLVITRLRAQVAGNDPVDAAELFLLLLEGQALIMIAMSALHVQKATADERSRQQRIVPPIVFPGR